MIRKTEENKMDVEMSETSESVEELIKRRSSIEDQIKALNDVLKSQGVDMREPLVDKEGFPRNDIDVYTVRNARKSIICLQTDFKNVTDQIETALHNLHAAAKQSKTQKVEQVSQAMDRQDETLSPFLLVDLVTDDSPSHKAGIMVDDMIVKFGSVTKKNFDGLRAISTIVQQSIGRVIPVVANRNGKRVEINLVPGHWNGKGLLGCNITVVK